MNQRVIKVSIGIKSTDLRSVLTSIPAKPRTTQTIRDENIVAVAITPVALRQYQTSILT
jgi:hypothetical protein